MIDRMDTMGWLGKSRGISPEDASGGSDMPRRPRGRAGDASGSTVSGIMVSGIMLACLILPAILSGCESAVKTDGPKAEAAAAGAPSATTEEELKQRIDAVLSYTLHERELRLDTHAAWQIIHGVAAFGPKFPVMNGDQQVRALNWVFAGNAMKGWTLRPGRHGVEAVQEPGTKAGQGHPDQWLGYMSLWGLPSSTPLTVAGRDYQIKDLVTQAMMDVRDGKEASWTLMALSTYLEPTQEWETRDGSKWSLERLVAMEAGADLSDEAARNQIHGTACGGSHRLIGLTYALNQRHERLPDAPLTGGWAVAHERIQWAVRQARKFQLPSGGFSVHYFARPASSPDLAEHLAATGHTLEFLALTLDQEQLAEPWVARAADFLCDIFEKTRALDLECGALYHAARGLLIYRHRRFGPRDYFGSGGSPSTPSSSGMASSGSEASTSTF